MIQDEHQPYDKSSKWLIQHHGDSVLRLAKVGRIANWRPAQAEVVQPRRLPDGLLEVRLEGEPRDDLFLIEVAYLRYNDVGLLTILGVRKVLLESPLIDELVMEKYGDVLTEKIREAARETACETAQRAIRTVLETRFGDVPRDLVEEIEAVELDDQLQGLTRTAAVCPDLDTFRRAVARS